MAEGFKYNVTCGVTEEDKKVTLMYKVPDPLERIEWNWLAQTGADGTISHVATMRALDSRRAHDSNPVPDHLFKTLGSPGTSKVDGGQYLKVTMSCKKGVSIEVYFDK